MRTVNEPGTVRLRQVPLWERPWYNFLMSKGIKLLLLTLFLGCQIEPALADYTIVLKNGRRITVQSYREDGRMIKFHGLGGEIGISKDQIQTIQKIGESELNGLTLSGSGADSQPASVERRGTIPEPAEKQLSPEEERAKEEKEYQQKLSAIDAQLKDAWDRYMLETRGTTSRDPTLLTTEEEIRKMNEDARARLRDAEHNPVDPGVVDLTVQSPFSTLGTTTRVLSPPPPNTPAFGSPPPFTERERELSDLRNRTLQLENERRQLIEEMRQKNFWTGSLSLE
jgi:hypothetical protein